MSDDDREARRQQVEAEMARITDAMIHAIQRRIAHVLQREWEKVVRREKVDPGVAWHAVWSALVTEALRQTAITPCTEGTTPEQLLDSYVEASRGMWPQVSVDAAKFTGWPTVWSDAALRGPSAGSA